MAKNRNTFAKQQRAVEKKRKAEAKRQRRVERKAAVTAEPLGDAESPNEETSDLAEPNANGI